MSETAYDAECIFCRIAAREIPSEVLHESDTVFAFRDTNPQAPVHILLIPKEHIASAAEIEDRHGGVLADLTQAASHLADAEGIVGRRLAAGHERRTRRRPERLPSALPPPGWSRDGVASRLRDDPAQPLESSGRSFHERQSVDTGGNGAQPRERRTWRTPPTK